MRRKTAGFRLFCWCLCWSPPMALLPTTVRAETRTAAALTPEAVWDAIDAAKDGDTVQLPEGTAVWKKRMEHQALGEDESDHHPGRRNRQDDHSRRIQAGPLETSRS